MFWTLADISYEFQNQRGCIFALHSQAFTCGELLTFGMGGGEQLCSQRAFLSISRIRDYSCVKLTIHHSNC